MKLKPFFEKVIFLFLISLLTVTLVCSCASRGEIKAEEYFSIGMAYYELGQSNTANRERYFLEAEKFLNRARAMDKTMTASDYNLGRIAFETGRYEDAARSFERVLLKDPDNVMALKAAAYSRIRNGNIEKAVDLYARVLELVPESADDGYNYALVLYGMKKYDACEDVLNKYPYALEDNASTMLLYARAQKIQGKVEAIDSYAKWSKTASPASPQGLYEFAMVLEDAGLFAMALEQYGAAISALTRDTDDLKKSTLMFEEARLFLVADPDNNEGIQKLSSAVQEGFSDVEAIRELLSDERITHDNKIDIRKIIDGILNSGQEEEETEEEEEPEEFEQPVP